MKHRQKTIEHQKENFASDAPRLLHRSGKLLSYIYGQSEKFNRLPITVAAQGVQYLLNVLNWFGWSIFQTTNILIESPKPSINQHCLLSPFFHSIVLNLYVPG